MQPNRLKFLLMKPTITALAAFFLFSISVSSQILPIKNSFQNDLARVVSDYPNGFRNIAGEETVANPQSTEFACKAAVKDASKCKIVKYSSTTRDVYSWEAEMLKTDDFNEASKKFRSIYNSLQHLSVNINGANAIFKSDYIKPSESIKFTTIIFDTGEKSPELKSLKIALMLEAEMLDWTIKIQVYEKERDDKDPGRAID